MKFKNLLKKGLIAGFLGMVSTSVFAERILLGQAKYGKSVVDIVLLGLNVLALAVAVGVLIAAVVMFVRDYVINKDQHSKKFKIVELVFAVIAATIVAVPTSSFLIGQDILAGEGAASLQSNKFQATDGVN